MGRKRTEINPESGNRLQNWLTVIGMTQKELATKLNITSIHLNNIINGRKHLTYERAVEISKLTQYYDENNELIYIRPEYLVCADDVDAMTNRDYDEQLAKYHSDNFKDKIRVSKGILLIIKYYRRIDSLNEWRNKGLDANEIIEKDRIQEYPNISSSDLKLICELTKDYVHNLVHTCLYTRDQSPLWKMEDSRRKSMQ